MEQHNEFGPWLRTKILDRLMTYAEFAEASGISEATLYRIVRHSAPMRRLTIAKIANALGVPREEVETQLNRHRATNAA